MALLDLIKPRVAELGAIKIGGLGEETISRNGNKFRRPIKFDYFVIVSKVRDKNGDFMRDEVLMQQLIEEYGDSDQKLRQIPIVLLSNNIDECMAARYCWYNGKKLAAESDGHKLVKYFDKKRNEWLETPEESIWNPEILDWKDKNGTAYFKLHTTLNCVIAAKSSRWGGYYRFRTNSQISASQILGSLLHIQELTGGILRGIPLRLVLRPMQVAPDGKVTTVHVVHVELIGDDLKQIQGMAMERIKYERENKMALVEANRAYMQAIAAPMSDDEHREVAEEFVPEHHEESPPAQVDPLAQQLGITQGSESKQTPQAPANETSVLEDDQGDAYEPDSETTPPAR